MPAHDVLQTLALVLATGLACQLAADALRLPRMVLLLVAGVALGPHALDAVQLPLDSTGVQLLLTLGVGFILFHGGLGLSLRVLRPVALGLGLLAVPGVVLTAVVTGAVASVAFGIPFEAGLLVGAVLAPTDPAILIPLFDRLRLRPKVSQTIIAESALNDPVGAVLALSFAAFVLGGEGSLGGPLAEFLLDLGISSALGLAFGVALATAISTRRAGIWSESPVIAVLLIVAAGFFSIDSAGGSGYLGAFVAGLMVGNIDFLGLGMHPHREVEVRAFAATATDVVVIFVFIALGAGLPLDELREDGLPALATVAALVVAARPLTVLTCLSLDRRAAWSRSELVFLAWTRETGVVPAAIAGVLVAERVPHATEIVSVVGLAIVITLLVQATTKRWLAKQLALAEGDDLSRQR
jgi:cell volume regulation protein A